MFSSSKLVNAVAQRLLDTIEQGRWVAGQMLPGQRELAEQMEISRPSLREAIMVLETLGVVRSLPGKGVMVLERSEPLREVAAPGEATMEDVLQLRYALEPFIVGIVAQSAGANCGCCCWTCAKRSRMATRRLWLRPTRPSTGAW